MDATSGGGAGFTVNRDNVLQIGRAFADEAARMQDRLSGYGERMVTEPALGDPASADFATSLNTRLMLAPDSYVRRAQAYIDELKGVAEHCAAAAKGYGFTDDQIASVMSGIGANLA